MSAHQNTAHNSLWLGAHLVLLVHFLHVDEVLAIVGGGGGGEGILDPLQLGLGVEGKLVPLQRLIQPQPAIRHRRLQPLKPVTVATQGLP